MNISVKVSAGKLLGKIARLRDTLQTTTQKTVLEKEAKLSLRRLKYATPVRWTGKTRKAWRIEHASRARSYGFRIINDTKEMLFLEKGTKAHGPKRAKFLYIPLNRRAARGWSPSLKIGRDYILKKWVRGIRAMHIVEKERKKTKARLKDSMREYISFVIKS